MRLTPVWEDGRAKERIHREVTEETLQIMVIKKHRIPYKTGSLINSTTSVESRKRMRLIWVSGMLGK